MKKIAILLGLLWAASANAQSPSPSQIGTIPSSSPYPVSILFNNTWYPLGNVNTTLGKMTIPIAGIVNGTTPILAYSNIWTALQVMNAGVQIGGSSGLISVLNPSASSSYNFNLPATAGAANAPLLSGGGGSTAMTWGTRSGNTTSFGTTSGAFTSGNCLKSDASGNIIDSGGACGGSSYTPGVDAVASCGVDNTGVTDTTTALNTCLTNNAAVSLRAGTYKISSCINVPNNGSLMGAGYGATIITTASTTINMICPGTAVGNVYISDLRVTRSVTPSAGAGVYSTNIGRSLFQNVYADNQYYGFQLGDTDFSTCDNCQAVNNYSHGFYFPSTTAATSPLQWSLRNTLSQFNDGWGYYIDGKSANTILGSLWLMTTSFANKLGGYAYVASGSGIINDIELVNITASGDCGDEVVFNTNGGFGNQINGGLIEYSGLIACGRNQSSPATNAGYGVNVSSIKSLSITGVQIWSNSYSGILATSTAGSLTITGNTIGDNGAYASGAFKSSIILSPSSGTLTANIGNNNLSPQVGSAYSTYGLVVGVNAKATILGNNVTGYTTGCYLLSATNLPAGSAAAYNYGTSCP